MSKTKLKKIKLKNMLDHENFNINIWQSTESNIFYSAANVFYILDIDAEILTKVFNKNIDYINIKYQGSDYALLTDLGIFHALAISRNEKATRLKKFIILVMNNLYNEGHISIKDISISSEIENIRNTEITEDVGNIIDKNLVSFMESAKNTKKMLLRTLEDIETLQNRIQELEEENKKISTLYNIHDIEFYKVRYDELLQINAELNNAISEYEMNAENNDSPTEAPPKKRTNKKTGRVRESNPRESAPRESAPRESAPRESAVTKRTLGSYYRLYKKFKERINSIEYFEWLFIDNTENAPEPSADHIFAGKIYLENGRVPLFKKFILKPLSDLDIQCFEKKNNLHYTDFHKQNYIDDDNI